MTTGDGPHERLTGFLSAEARRAGLGSRDIAAGLARARERSARDAAATGSPDPLAKLPSSSSHVDRLLKGRAPAPSWPFVREFLKVTCEAAGLPVEEYRKRCAAAVELLRAASGPVATAPAVAPDSTVAALRLEVELERARHTETRLRYALRDSQLLIATMCFIVNVLREIIADLHGTDGAGRALALKRTAEAESDRAVARIRTLEVYWEQARRELRDLALHADAAEPHRSPGVGAGVVPQELLAGPALDDIAGALARAKAFNAGEDEVARELGRALAGPPADEEFAVLLAAAELGGYSLRREAVRGLLDRWTDRPETAEVMTRLVDDPDLETRLMVVRAVAQVCPGDPVVLTALLRQAGEGRAYQPCLEALRALYTGWPGDARARDVYVELSADPAMLPYAVQAMAFGCAGDAAVRDHLLTLADCADAAGRQTVAKAFERGWPGDEAVLGVLLRLAGDEHLAVSGSAVEALCAGWHADPRVRAFLIDLIGRAQHVWAAASVVERLVTRWPGDRGIATALEEFAGRLPDYARFAEVYSRTTALPPGQP